MTSPALPVRIMGILNITPDSFSDGGQFNSTASALTQAEAMIEAGADILDIGGESTRPFADPVTQEEELERVIPVIKKIREKHSTPISIDTTKAEVAREALQAGADIINDISALQKDAEMLRVVQETSVPVIIMHMQGNPSDMQLNPEYDDVVTDICNFFKQRVAWLRDNQVDTSRLILDPGIGFGKKCVHNLSILKHLNQFVELGYPILLGHSRKRFIGDITGITEEKKRDLPTAVVSALSFKQGISILRVHDVAGTRQAVQIANAIETSP